MPLAAGSTVSRIQRLFDYGALFVVDVLANIVLSKTKDKITLNWKGGATDSFCSYDRRIEKYVEQTAANKHLRYGCFQATRTNFWNTGNDDTRGCASRESTTFVVRENIAAPSHHILKNPPSGRSFSVQNTHGSSWMGTGQNAGQSATTNMWLSFFVRKVDGSAVTSADVIVWFGTAASDWTTNLAGPTSYQSWGNGWYRIYAMTPFIGVTTTVQQGLKIAPGVKLFLELPQHERTNTTQAPTDPIITNSTTDRVRDQTVLEVMMNSGLTLLCNGAMAVGFVPELDSDKHGTAVLAYYGVPDGNGFMRIYLSSSEQRLVFQTAQGAQTETFCEADKLGAFSRGTAIGACAQWRRYSELHYELEPQSIFAVNGKIEEKVNSISSAQIVTGVAPRFMIGGLLNTVDVASLQADSRIRFAAFFNKVPGHAGCADISNIMKELTESSWPWILA